MSERAQALEALVEYVAWHGPMHEDDCPCDDTCDCQFKRINAGVNLACRLLAAKAPPVGVSPQPDESEHPTRLAQIRERAEKATEGPWRVEFNDCDEANINAGQSFDEFWVAKLPHQCLGSIEEAQKLNADFIAHAREDVPYLLSLLAPASLSPVEPTPQRAQHVATCETNGHIYGHAGVCVFCQAPKPADPVEPTPTSEQE